MNILIVHPCKGFYGGAEEVVVQLTDYLEANGHQARIITKNAPIGRLTQGKWLHNSNSWSELWTWTLKSSEWADVICCFNFPATLATISFYKEKPIVWYCNEPPELFTNFWRKPIEALNRRLVRKSGMAVVVADQVNEQRFYRLYGVRPQTLPYGVDYEFWSKSITFTEDPNKIRLLQVGTISPYKNQLHSICTLAELLCQKVDATLTFAGGIKDQHYYDNLIGDYISLANIETPGLKDRVEWLGQQTPEEVRDLYNNHDILLHPVLGQGGWLVPFEAMCAGLPVITTQDFSGWRLIKKYDLGIVDTPAAVAIKNETYQRLDLPMIESWVEENLTWKKFGEGMVKIFEEAINGRQ